MTLPRLTGDIGTHDPTIVREGDRYYRFATGDGISVAVSSDLVHWESAGKVFAANPDWTSVTVPGSTWFWAPEIVFRQGFWRLYYSVSTFGSQVSAIGMAMSRTLDPSLPTTAWVDRGVVVQSKQGDDFNAIDPAIVSDEKGNDWLIWGSFWGGLKIRPLQTDGFVLPNSSPTTIASRQLEPNTIEGGYALFRNGWFYLFCSFDFCCRGMNSTYRIAIGRSRAVQGPYVDQEGRELTRGGGTVLRHGDDDSHYVALGHNSLLIDQGRTWLVCHGYDRFRDGAPILVLEELNWPDDKDAWPSLA